jgi:hypothetical protein
VHLCGPRRHQRRRRRRGTDGAIEPPGAGLGINRPAIKAPHGRRSGQCIMHIRAQACVR